MRRRVTIIYKSLIMNDLCNIRNRIDRIDDQLLALLLERFALMKDVAEAKKSSGVPLTDSAREESILTRRSSEAPGYEDEVRDFFSSLMELSKRVQRRY